MAAVVRNEVFTYSGRGKIEMLEVFLGEEEYDESHLRSVKVIGDFGAMVTDGMHGQGNKIIFL